MTHARAVNHRRPDPRLLRPAAGDADFDQELELHLAMAEEDKVRRGLSPEQARREARLELGGVAQLREAAREARGLPWLETFWLDGKLGLRMLRKSWGLTLVGGLAMAVTIGLGASISTSGIHSPGPVCRWTRAIAWSRSRHSTKPLNAFTRDAARRTSGAGARR